MSDSSTRLSDRPDTLGEALAAAAEFMDGFAGRPITDAMLSQMTAGLETIARYYLGWRQTVDARLTPSGIRVTIRPLPDRG